MYYQSTIRNPRPVRSSFYKIGSVILLAILALYTMKSAKAQVVVTTNIVSQPLWGPVNYNYVDYYYLPEAGAYYYVPTNQFIYMNGSNWIFAPSLPPTYTVDLFRTYKVVLNTPTPYLRHVVYSKKYAKYKKVKSNQVAIRDSRNKKYFVVKGHPGPGKVKTVKQKSSKPAVVKSKSSKPYSAAARNNKPASVAKPKGSNVNGSKVKGKKG